MDNIVRMTVTAGTEFQSLSAAEEWLFFW